MKLFYIKYTFRVQFRADHVLQDDEQMDPYDIVREDVQLTRSGGKRLRLVAELRRRRHRRFRTFRQVAPLADAVARQVGERRRQADDQSASPVQSNGNGIGRCVPGQRQGGEDTSERRREQNVPQFRAEEIVRLVRGRVRDDNGEVRLRRQRQKRRRDDIGL